MHILSYIYYRFYQFFIYLLRYFFYTDSDTIQREEEAIKLDGLNVAQMKEIREKVSYLFLVIANHIGAHAQIHMYV